MVSFPIILKNIYSTFNSILKDPADLENNLKDNLKSGLLTTSKTNITLRWMFLIGEENDINIYKEGHQEIFCNWAMFDHMFFIGIRLV